MSVYDFVRRAVVGAVVVVLVASSAAGSIAQQPTAKPAAFDRSAIPAPGSTPELRVPAWTSVKLANGAELVVSSRHNLPLVSFTINFVGGSNQYDPETKPGVGEFAGAMLSEGTSTKSGDDISNALQLLGTGGRIGVGGETGAVSFVATTDKVERVLQIVEDLLVNPAFPVEAIERYRARRLVALTQAKDRASAIAGRVFPKVLYTDTHPYGRAVTEQSVNAIKRDDIVALAKSYFTPGHAIISVVGDVEPNAVKEMVERVLAPWSAGGSVPTFEHELKTAEDNIVQGLPQNFSSVRAVNSSISAIYLEDLPQDYFQHFAQSVRAVTKDDVVRVANKYIDVDHLAIVIVGDRKTIEQPLKATGIAPVVLLDINGDPVAVP